VITRESTGKPRAAAIDSFTAVKSTVDPGVVVIAIVIVLGVVDVPGTTCVIVAASIVPPD